MTIRITDEMLARMPEHKLLRAMRARYEWEEESDKGIEGLASVAHVTGASMISALNGKRSIGGDGWVRIEKHFRTNVYHLWLALRAEIK